MVTALSVSFAGLGAVVMVVAIVALLAFVALLLFARSMAKRLGLEGLKQVPPIVEAMKGLFGFKIQKK